MFILRRGNVHLCDTCKTPVYIPRCREKEGKRFFCSNKCRVKGNRGWVCYKRRTGHIHKCRVCNKDVYISAYREKHTKFFFCGRQCYGVYKETASKGANNPMFGKRRLDVSCRNEILKKENKYWLGRNHRLESKIKDSISHRRYKPEETKEILKTRGTSEYRLWIRRAKTIMHYCFLCSKKFHLTAHHIIPIIQCLRSGRKDLIVSDRNRLILCSHCHGVIHDECPDTVHPKFLSMVRDIGFVITGDLPGGV